MTERESRQKKVAFFGHFDSSNFGNESSLQAILYHLRCFFPDSEVTCICTGPEATVATHQIDAIPISGNFLRSWIPRNPLTRILRKCCVAAFNEPYQWVKGLSRLRHTDILIIPGTGLLTDAYGLLSWGPYGLFKWSMIAKLCRCKLALVSIGAGPIHTAPGRYLLKTILSLADFRSYRDSSTAQFLESVGFRTDSDEVYPDLAFSLPEAIIPQQNARAGRRSVVGLGVMEYPGKYSTPGESDTIYSAYLENLAKVVEWLLERDYDVRLLSGDLSDMQARQEFRRLLKGRLSADDETHIFDEPVHSVEDVLSQIGATDVVVATRFHNILLSFLCTKPVISISFHHKCDSLMNAMGMSAYCLDMGKWEASSLIEKFEDIEKNSDRIKLLIREKAQQFRENLDRQYELIFRTI
jgi:polysaccharide pyruvyl transferase WcaK-like protein